MSVPLSLVDASPGRGRRACLEPLPGIALARGRLHEVCGSARHTFALWLAGRLAGAVLWIAPAWQGAGLHPDGMIAFADPGRFLFLRPDRLSDMLWCAEEALRSGAAPLVVLDLPEPPALTPVRRLHLAAEAGGAGAAGAAAAPLGLALTPGEGGAQGIETRWHMAPAHDPTRDGAGLRWRLERRRARALPPAAWQLCGHPGPEGGMAMRMEADGDGAGLKPI